MDNTGNTRTWPSEELLAFYLLENPEILKSLKVLDQKLSICELGAGMSGLAGFSVAYKYKDDISKVNISDGNQ